MPQLLTQYVRSQSLSWFFLIFLALFRRALAAAPAAAAVAGSAPLRGGWLRQEGSKKKGHLQQRWQRPR